MKQTEQGATHFIAQVAPVTKNLMPARFRPILGRAWPDSQKKAH
ncbi:MULTISPECIES: hypothetical protein [Pseudomonas syringae group]|nr:MULTISPECIES: hypothetical protein [Pseudomonas syringae group]KPB69385.1 Unknown protein sequence [Pseudomonas syringae pv. maculicola]